MKRRLLPLLAGLTLASAAVNAADWVRIRTPADGHQYLYDRSKLFIHNNEITYWKKVVFLSPQPFKEKWAASGLYRERIHCAEHTLKLISYLLYAPGGEVIEYVSTAEGEAAPIIPDSLGDVFERALCPLVWQKQEEARLKAEAERAKAEQAQLKQEEERIRAEAEAAKPPQPESSPTPPPTAAPAP